MSGRDGSDSSARPASSTWALAGGLQPAGSELATLVVSTDELTGAHKGSWAFLENLGRMWLNELR